MTNVGEDVEQLEPYISNEYKMAQFFWKVIWLFIKKLSIHDPVILPLCVYQRDLKTYVHKIRV